MLGCILDQLEVNGKWWTGCICGGTQRFRDISHLVIQGRRSRLADGFLRIQNYDQEIWLTKKGLVPGPILIVEKL